MLTILSPAKKLLSAPVPFEQKSSSPCFLNKTEELVALMREKSVQDIAALMSISTDLAELNYKRFQSFSSKAITNPLSCLALYLFQGDVYQGLQASSWNKATIEYSQTHLAILSGLYGVLKPLDLIQPHRLEMGTRLANAAGKNLYDFWRNSVTDELNLRLKTVENPLVINLASSEYFKVIDTKKINFPIITINFYEKKNDQLKTVGIHAKKARGVMARFIMQHRIDQLEHLLKFNDLDYRFCEDSSTDKHLDFVREH